MKAEKRIALYLSDSMSQTDRKTFESDLEKIPGLKEEYEKTLGLLKNLKTLSISADETGYFNNLIPVVRQRLGKNKKTRFYPKLAYVLPVLAVIAVLIFKPFNANKYDSVTDKTIMQLNEQTKSEILAEIIDNEATLPSELKPELSSSELIDLKLENELYKTDEVKLKYLDTDDLISNLSKDETQNIYNNLLKKRIL